jgi:threonine dehydratase
MIDHYRTLGDSRFAISSSGNAALAAAIHVQKLNKELTECITLDIFVGNHIAEHKFKKLQKYADDHIRILKKERPIQALTEAINTGMRSLRQSTDDTALIGYESLGEELVSAFDDSGKKNKNSDKLGALFIGTSSGTTAQALASYFLKNSPKKIPQIHIVQTSSCHPLSTILNPYDGPEEKSEADAITDITALRTGTLIPLIEKTGGYGWTATNDDIETVKILTKKHAGLDISNNSALSIVGAMKSVYEGHTIDGAVVCMICGD